MSAAATLSLLLAAVLPWMACGQDALIDAVITLEFRSAVRAITGVYATNSPTMRITGIETTGTSSYEFNAYMQA